MRPDFDNQFAEDVEERAERWRATKAKRKAEGRCWQCAKLIADCACPNVKHDDTWNTNKRAFCAD